MKKIEIEATPTLDAWDIIVGGEATAALHRYK